MYGKLVAKVNNIDTSGFVLKTKYDTDKSDLENKISDADKKIPDTSKRVKKIDYDAKITETESKIPSNPGLATTAALTTNENKIPAVSILVKKTPDSAAKIFDIKSEYFTKSDYNKFTNEKLDLKIKQKGLVNKSDITRFIYNADLDKKKVALLATKAELKAEEEKTMKLQAFKLFSW